MCRKIRAEDLETLDLYIFSLLNPDPIFLTLSEAKVGPASVIFNGWWLDPQILSPPVIVRPIVGVMMYCI